MSRKEKFALYLPPELRAEVEEHCQEDGSRSLTAFIENAVLDALWPVVSREIVRDIKDCRDF